jgi:ribosome maturation factor RimP
VEDAPALPPAPFPKRQKASAKPKAAKPKPASDAPKKPVTTKAARLKDRDSLH